MTEILQVDPSSIVTSEFNERTEVIEESDDDSPSLVDSVSELGIVEPPKVRETDEEGYDYEVIVGQRRVKASQEAGFDTIEVILGEWDDQEALTMSISENVDSFKESVSPTDRAEALLSLWELMGGNTDEKPSPSKLSDKLGISKTTIGQWLEVLDDRWRDSDTVTKPIDDGSSVEQTETIADKLGERKMVEIRKATDTQEESDEVAERVFEEGLSQVEVKDLRTHLEDGIGLDDAVERVKDSGNDEPQSFTDFSNLSDDETPDLPDSFTEIDDPTEVTEEEVEEDETTTQDTFSQQIRDIEMVEVVVEEGEIDFTLELPEKTYERAEEYASNFGYETVEDLLVGKTIPEFLNSDDGKETITEILEEKAKARGY